MKVRAIAIGLSLLWIAACCQDPHRDQRSRIIGDYLGEVPPGKKAKVFAPAVVSTELNEDGGPVFTADGDEVFWRIGGAPFSTICTMRRSRGVWSEPMIAPFSGRYQDAGLAITPAGDRIFFASKRPVVGDEGTQKFSTWTTEKIGGEWQQPVSAGAPIDHPDDYYTRISVSADGTVFKQSSAAGGKGGWDLYLCRAIDGRYSEQESLSGSVNTEYDEYAPAISPDGGFVVFQSGDRPDSAGAIDLYVSFRLVDGSWSRGINLGDKVNTEHVEKWPSITADGRYLFFISDRPLEITYAQSSKTRKSLEEITSLYRFYHFPKAQPGWGDVYWIATGIIDDLRHGISD